jgi:hypothetical protein
MRNTFNKAGEECPFRLIGMIVVWNRGGRRFEIVTAFYVVAAVFVVAVNTRVGLGSRPVFITTLLTTPPPPPNDTIVGWLCNSAHTILTPTMIWQLNLRREGISARPLNIITKL